MFTWSTHNLSWADSETIAARIDYSTYMPPSRPCTNVDNCYEVLADSDLVPTGIETGSSFRLMFLSSTKRDASSTDIADYNTFIQARANAGHSAIQGYAPLFRAIGSTADSDARDNTATNGTGVPIYWLRGNKAADDYADFYDGGWDEEASVRNESGGTVTIPHNVSTDDVWTGSARNGTEGFQSGASHALGTANPFVGTLNNSVNPRGPLNNHNTSEPKANTNHLYGLSPVFKVVSHYSLTETDVPSDWTLVPDGLTTGDSFRLLFITSTTRDARSSNIADYNSFVQTAAAAGHAHVQAYSSNFQAVASTDDTDARDNTATSFTSDNKGFPIYWLGGTKVVDDYEDFYDGSWDDEANAKDESGNARSTSAVTDYPWTGSEHDGTVAILTPWTLGLGAISQPPVVGVLNSTAQEVHGPLYGGQRNKSNSQPLYALSGLFKIGTNGVPVFTETAPAARSLPENTPAGENVGAPVTATDVGSADTLVYSLDSDDGASFDIDTTNGQILTKPEVSYDYETQSLYSVTVSVSDGTDTATLAVTITVTNLEEPPAAPEAPTVTTTAGVTDSLDVTWTAPDNTGRPAITDYDVQYRSVGSETWTDLTHIGTDRSTTIATLATDTHYKVQVRATNDDGTGPWSDPGQAPTNGPPTEVPSAWGLIPTGLATGDKFRILFATSTTRDATSTDISEYNTFVRTAAAAGHADIQAYSAEFTVVGSTSATDARVNTRTTYTPDEKGVPIYWLDGTKVADEYEDFYDGDWDDEANAKDESGNARSLTFTLQWPFTGSDQDGTESFSSSVSRALGTDAVRVGRPDNSAVGQGPLTSNSHDSKTDSKPFYAISPVFVIDVSPGVTITPTSLTVTEGSTADYTVELSVLPTADVTINITGGGDVTVNPSSLTFSTSTWNMAQTVTVTAARDSDSDDDTQTVTHTVATNSAAEYLGATLDGLAVTVTDDDVTVTFDLATYSVNEGSTVTVKVQLNADPKRNLTIPISTTNQEGATNADYSGVPASVAFASGDMEKSFTFTATEDTVDDNGESVKLSFGTLPTGVTAGTTNEATITITGPISVPQGWALTPTGLGQGDKFRLLFITHTGHSSANTDIENYNAYVQSQANAGNAHADIKAYSSWFRVLGSTESIDARDNTMTTGTGVPIYWMNGDKVADNYADFYDGSWDSETAADRTGTTSSASVRIWTGSDSNGVEAIPGAASRALGTNAVRLGRLNGAGDPISTGNTANAGTNYRYYALSNVFVVGEPTSTNNAATGLPTITGTARVNEVLTADTSGINDDDGITSVSYEYQWAGFDGTVTTNITGATSETYTLQPEDAGSQIQVTITFTDDLSNPEGPLSSALTDAVNTPATGAPTITGAARVSQVLTANTSDITDADGTDSATFAFQWVRFDGTDDTEIDGATASTYQLTDVDANKQVKVKVTFTDDAGAPAGDEGPLVSLPTEHVVPHVLIKNTGKTSANVQIEPTADFPKDGQGFTTGPNVSGYTLGSIGIKFHNIADTSTAASELTVTINSATNSGRPSSTLCTLNDPLSFSSSGLHTFATPKTGANLCPTLSANTKYFVVIERTNDNTNTINYTTTYDLNDDAAGATGWSIEDASWFFTDSTSLWGGGGFKVQIEVRGPTDNAAATGAPSISGVLQQTEVLTADTASIADADGVGAFSYQWTADGTDISGATSATHTITSTEVGKAISVRVSFTDGQGYSESVSSAATYAVVASGATARLYWLATMTVGAEPDDGLYGYSDFAHSHLGAITAPQFTVADVQHSAIRVVYDLSGADNHLSLYLSPPFTRPFTLHTGDIATAFASSNANQTTIDDYRIYTWVNSFPGWAAGQQVAVFLQGSLNNPATGAPTITGDARVNEVLTANTSGITDDDGTASATFTYQWISFDGTDDTDISGATSSTYTVQPEDAGKQIKVQVNFTDDLSYAEGPFYSLLTNPVNSPAKGAPTITGKPRVARVLSANTAEISDADGTASATFAYQWVRFDGTNDADINGATSLTYTLKSEDADKQIKVSVTFTDDAGDTEGPLTSLPTEYVAAADVLVKNTGHTTTNEADIADCSTKYGQRFTSGPSLTGYTLTSIGVHFTEIGNTATVGAELTATLNADSSGAPGDALCTLADPNNFSASGLHAFTAPTTGTDLCPELEPSTTYFVVLERANLNTATIEWSVTSTLGQHLGSANGWSIDDRGHIYNNALSTWVAFQAPSNLIIQVKGDLDDEVTVPSDWSLKPSSLNAGAKFRILFLTDTSHPTSSSINSYNGYVQGQADAGHADIQSYAFWFRMLGSTASTNARDNTGTTYTATAKGLPIYWLNGAKVVDDYEDFYDGTWDDEANPRYRDGTTLTPDEVWSGSQNDGTESFHQGSSQALGNQLVRAGRLNGAGGPFDSGNAYVTTTNWRYYALSGIFEVGPPDPGVTITPPTLTVNEGSTADYKVKLTVAPTADVTISITGAGDVSVAPASLTFSTTTWSTDQTVTVTAAQDSDTADDMQNVTHAVDTVSADEYLGATLDSLDVTVTDDETPGITATPSTLTVAEGGTADYTVELSVVPTADVTINITGGGDVTVNPSSLTFSSTTWNMAQTVTVTAGRDSDSVDDSQTVAHTVATGSAPEYIGATLAGMAVTVTDNDVTATFELATYSVGEGNTVTVKVQLNADPKRNLTIPITTTNQDGATTDDYSGVPASLAFASGDTEKSFTFTAAQDTDDDESVQLSLGTLPAGVNGQATVNITDDDDPAVTVSFEQSTYSVAEGDTVDVKVQLNDDPERSVTIPITATNQAGATSADYSGIPASIAFASGETEKTITFTAIQDTISDDAESIKIGFGTFPTGVTAGTTNEATVTITDNSDPAVTVKFEHATYTVAEGSTATVKIQLNVDPEREVLITLTTTDQAGATSADYSGIPDSVTFQSGDTEKSFTFTAVQDTDDDGESVKLTFGTLPASVSAGTPNEATFDITDDDDPTVTAKFEFATYSVGEGNTVTVKVQLNADPKRNLTIPITSTNQDGATSGDYSGVPASLAFASGDTEKSFIFTAVQDTDDDDSESVKLGFGTFPTGVTGGTPNEAVVSITDDDPTVTVSFERSAYTVAEGSTTSIKVLLTDDPERTVIVPLNTTNQAGATSVDYSGVPTTVTFQTGDKEKSFTFTAIDDTIDDNGESVKLTFGTLPTGVTAGSTNEATVTITGPVVIPEIQAPRGWTLTPDGLIQGDKFRLLFITFTGHSSANTDIDNYNAYVQSQANASNAHPAIKPYSYSFRVLASTADVDARDNTGTTGTGVPIYWMGGEKIADDYPDLYDGSWDSEMSSGRAGIPSSSAYALWTGSENNGTRASANGVYQTLGTASVRIGSLNGSGEPLSSLNTIPGTNYHYYALSGIFIAPNTDATGQPAITGTPRVNETLSVDTSGITDPEGTANAAFTYQWVRVDDGDETDIDGATRSTYNPTDQDVDKYLKVRVSFTDDNGAAEGPLESEPTATIAGRDVLVRNTGQITGIADLITDTSRSKYAQAFTTGPNADGYTLNSIALSFDFISDTNVAGSILTVTLNEESTSPSAALCTLRDPPSFTASGLQIFTAPTTGSNLCPKLAASTTYFVVITRALTDPSTVKLDPTTSSDEDAGSAAGWSIADDHYVFGNAWTKTTSQSLQIEVKGTTATEAVVSDHRTWIENRQGDATTEYENTADFTLAQGFRTGGTAGVYEIHEITIDFDRGQPEPKAIQVRIVESSSLNVVDENAIPTTYWKGGSFPKRRIGTDPGTYTFKWSIAQSSGYNLLQANTNYFVTIESTSTDSSTAALVRMTESRDQTTNDGWTVDDHVYVKHKHDGTGWSKENEQVRIRIAGQYHQGVGIFNEPRTYESCHGSLTHNSESRQACRKTTNLAHPPPRSPSEPLVHSHQTLQA